eukprot:CAMPEP_0198294308 /NCGR_PEP_ID=MMETSP1449-20131203/21699_1 /TAXON_ID=420275 /ORGANISM="Attheya septentrionalis, Strain CCMP2084" /LENGTH=65 /DNA_ID=CAMNT_0043994221 /DNA_START=44 /DNA_END=237 /DNA_ORIENTATION=+
MPPPPPPSKSYSIVFVDSSDEEEEEEPSVLHAIGTTVVEEDPFLVTASVTAVTVPVAPAVYDPVV